jgi:hypothetical protein
MRWVVAATILPALLAGCGAKYKPKEAVHNEWQRAVEYPPFTRNKGLQYLSGPATAAPVVPFMAFGAAFDLDLVTMHTGDDLDMLELARITTPQGPMWLALESEPVNGDQVLIARVPGDIDAWMPELPLRRKNDSSFRVDDTSGKDSLELTATYENFDGQIVEATYQGEPPVKTNRKRNGNTFNHSQNAVLAALDVSQSESLFKASVKIDGKRESLKRVAGVVPGQFVLVQAQGGIAVGGYQIQELDAVDWENPFDDIEVYDPNAAPPPPPAPSVDPVALVRGALATGIPAIQACHTARLADSPDLAGRMVVTFDLDTGKLKEQGTDDLGDADDALVDEVLVACLAEAMPTWAWPSVTGSGSQELIFVGAEGDTAASVSFGDFEFAGKMVDAPVARPPAPEGDLLGDDEDEAEAAPKATKVEPKAPEEAPKATKVEPKEAPKATPPKEEAPKAAPPKATPPAEGDTPQPEDGGGDSHDDLEDILGDDDPMATPPMAEPVSPPLSHFTTSHQMASGKVVQLPWQVTMNGDTVTARQSTEIRDLVYTWSRYGEALELSSITVEQYGRPTPVTAIHFSPALPDLRRRFNGKQRHKYVIDINGQRSMAVGEVEVFWEEAGPKVRVIPTAPEWTEERSLVSSIVYGADGSVSVSTQRAK